MSGLTCRSAREAILDLARDVPVPSPLVRAVEAHLQECPACVAELQRQRELTAGLEAIATRVQVWTGSAAMEAELLEQFATLHGQAAAPKTGGHRHTVWYGAVAAALLLCTVAIGIRESGEVRQATSGSRTPSPAPAAVARANLTPPDANAAARRADVSATVEHARPAGGRRRAGPQLANAAAARPVEFTVLPDAAGLPAFESGTIVRVEVPVAELPAYGLKIPPDAALSNIEADLLVGQDGQARAIRLVSEPQNTRSRQ